MLIVILFLSYVFDSEDLRGLIENRNIDEAEVTYLHPCKTFFFYTSKSLAYLFCCNHCTFSMLEAGTFDISFRSRSAKMRP